MNEYISREVVLSNCADIWDNADETTQTGVDVINTIDKITDFIESLPSADVQPVNQWISCKDKMPEDNTLVLFVYVSKNGVKSVHYGYHQTLKGLGSSWAKPSGGLQYCDDDVTHWMPLPEPPKDGDTNG